MSNQQEFQTYFHLWRWEGATQQSPAGIHCEDWPLYESEQAKALLFQRAQSFGPSISAFIRAFAALKQEGAIRQIRSKNPLAVDPESVLTKEMYQKMPAAQIVMRYRSDPEFKNGVDELIRRGEI
jgi:hypothetical protein